jgi:hypothetical protein
LILDVPPPDAVSGGDGTLARLLGWVLDHAPGRIATALRIATGDDRPTGGTPPEDGAGTT